MHNIQGENPIKRRGVPLPFIWKIVLSLILTFFPLTGFAFTPAGTPISNTATATYTDDNGFPYIAVSNSIVIFVSSIFGISITPDNQEKSAITGSEVCLPYILRNIGNSSDSYTLTPQNLNNDNGDLENLSVYIDRDRDGELDFGELLYDNSNPVTLSANEVLPILLCGKIPSNVLTGDIRVILNGFSNSNPSKKDLNNL